MSWCLPQRNTTSDTGNTHLYWHKCTYNSEDTTQASKLVMVQLAPHFFHTGTAASPHLTAKLLKSHKVLPAAAARKSVVLSRKSGVVTSRISGDNAWRPSQFLSVSKSPFFSCFCLCLSQITCQLLASLFEELLCWVSSSTQKNQHQFLIQPFCTYLSLPTAWNQVVLFVMIISHN